MVHTSNIIDTAILKWRKLIGNSICNANSFSLSQLDELAEVVLTTETNAPFHISWMQEDGAGDDRLFYWLSLSDSSHFKGESLASSAVQPPNLESIAHSTVKSIKLFGVLESDAIFASLLQTDFVSVAIATILWLPHKQRFSRFGSEALTVLDATVLQSCAADQGLELIAELN